MHFQVFQRENVHYLDIVPIQNEEVHLHDEVLVYGVGVRFLEDDAQFHGDVDLFHEDVVLFHGVDVQSLVVGRDPSLDHQFILLPVDHVRFLVVV